MSYVGYAKEYAASFGVAQIALKLGDKGLQVATDALMLTGLEETKPLKPVLNGIKTIRCSFPCCPSCRGESVWSKAIQNYWRSLSLGSRG